MMQSLRKKYEPLFRGELLNSCAPFWLNYGVDRKNGGVLNCLDREGNVYSTDKSVWMQGRTAWTFSHLYRKFEQKPEYLSFAESCLSFANAHCIDRDGRMFFTVTEDGRPLRKRRYWFSETFYILANAEYAMAAQDASALERAKRYYDFVLKMYRDPESDPYRIAPKCIASTRSMKALARPMILLNVASVMRGADPERTELYDADAAALIEDIKCFYFPGKHALLENVTADNRYLNEAAEGRIVNPGHDIEASWFLLEEGLYRGDGALIDFAKTVFDDAIARGWDEEYGGILYFKDLEGKPVEAYEHDMKLWWPHNEAVIASLKLYRATGEQKYADWFERITEYAFSHFSDRKYGEWYGYLRRDGKPTEPPCKGHTYKGAFHVMRMLMKVLECFDD